MLSRLYPLIIFLLLIAQLAWSEPIRLFENGAPVSNYMELLKATLRSGAVLEFENGSTFQVLEVQKSFGVLGYGQNNLILKVSRLNPPSSEVSALRLPITSRHGSTIHGTLTSFSFFRGNPSVAQVRTHMDGQFIEMELIPHRFSLEDYTDRIEGIDLKTRQRMAKALGAFGRNLSQYERISDYYPFQVVFDEVKSRWVLLDWGGRLDIAEKGSLKTLFDLDYSAVPADSSKNEKWRELLWRRWQVENFLKSTVLSARSSRLQGRALSCARMF